MWYACLQDAILQAQATLNPLLQNGQGDIDRLLQNVVDNH
jgi:hypothetical protein